MTTAAEIEAVARAARVLNNKGAICSKCAWWRAPAEGRRDGLCTRVPEWAWAPSVHWCGEFVDGAAVVAALDAARKG